MAMGDQDYSIKKAQDVHLQDGCSCGAFGRVCPPHRSVAQAIKEAEIAASDAALVFVVQLLKRSGSLGAAKLVEALREDSRRMRAGIQTGFAALRESVLLPQ